MGMSEKEIAAGNDEQRPNETHEPKIYESGYFYLSQQINDLRDRTDAKFDRVDIKFESMKKEIDARFDRVDAKFDAVHKEIKDLSDKTDARFEAARRETDARFDKLDDKINVLQRWAFGIIVTVVLAFVAIYFK